MRIWYVVIFTFLSLYLGIMSTAWDLYDSYNALELSSVPKKQSIIDLSTKASVPPKDQDQRGPGSIIEKSKFSFFNDVFTWHFLFFSFFPLGDTVADVSHCPLLLLCCLCP